MFVNSVLSSLLLASTIASAATIPQVIGEDKIILFGNGRTEIVDKAEYWKTQTIAPGPLAVSNGTAFNGTSEKKPSALNRRCKSTSIFHENKDSTFANWDVPMSSVVKSAKDGTNVAVTAGYQISNAISVSATASLTLVQDFLSASYGISYTESWTSSYASSYTFPVPAGKYGVVVSNPWTTRKSGYVNIGCVGEATEKVTYQADSYKSKAYDGLSWVEGTISLCTSDSYPVPYCIGSGHTY